MRWNAMRSSALLEGGDRDRSSPDSEIGETDNGARPVRLEEQGRLH
jgi:hypothetical protein